MVLGSGLGQWQCSFEHERVAMSQKRVEIWRCSFSHLIALLAALCCLFCLTSAYSGLIPADPANPGKCIYRGDTLSLGVNNGISPCQRLTCNADDSILIEGCGKLRLENCNRGERINLGKPFPECCKLKYKCKKPDGTPYYVEHDVGNSENATDKSSNST